MIASGWLWTECSHRTTSSDFTPSMCALSYLTTPSSPVSTGPSPLTAMMEWASTPGSIGMIESVFTRSEEHTSELQSQSNLVCRLLLEKKQHNLDTHS